jgi:hypothetical protein
MIYDENPDVILPLNYYKGNRISPEIYIEIFMGCDWVTSITVPEYYTAIGSCFAENCSNLQYVYIPSTVTYIDGWAFCNSYNLRMIHYGGTIKQWFNACKAWFTGEFRIDSYSCIIYCSDGWIDPYTGEIIRTENNNTENEVKTEIVTNPEENVAYVMYLDQKNLEEIYYATGSVSENKFLNTTDDISESRNIYVEKAENGGFVFYFLDEDEKRFYIHIYLDSSNLPKATISTDTACVFVYREDINVWITNVDGVDAYLGSYSSWPDISASNISYITPENTGVTQFVVGLMKKV